MSGTGLDRRFVAAVLVVFGIWAAGHLVRAHQPSLLLVETFNAGHAPMAGVLSLLLLRLCRRPGWPPWTAYVAAFTLCVAAGGLLEMLQLRGPRDADPIDVLRNAVGAAAFLSVRATLERPARSVGTGSLWRWAVRLAAVLAIGAMLLPPLRVARATHARGEAFPVVLAADQRWVRPFLYGLRSRVEFVPAPGSWAAYAPRQVIRWTMDARVPYPAVVLTEPEPDWSAFVEGKLVVDLFSAEDHAVAIGVRVHDRSHDDRLDDRFNGTYTIPPGATTVEIDLAAIRDAPAGRRMDVSRIAGFSLFGLRPRVDHSLYVGDVRLVRGGPVKREPS